MNDKFCQRRDDLVKTMSLRIKIVMIKLRLNRDIKYVNSATRVFKDIIDIFIFNFVDNGI